MILLANFAAVLCIVSLILSADFAAVLCIVSHACACISTGAIVEPFAVGRVKQLAVTHDLAVTGTSLNAAAQQVDVTTSCTYTHIYARSYDMNSHASVRIARRDSL